MWDSRGIALCFHNLGTTGGERSTSSLRTPFFLGEVPHGTHWWASEPVWTLWRRVTWYPVVYKNIYIYLCFESPFDPRIICGLCGCFQGGPYRFLWNMFFLPHVFFFLFSSHFVYAVSPGSCRCSSISFREQTKINVDSKNALRNEFSFSFNPY